MGEKISDLSTPPEWEERFYIKRIDEEDIEITLPQRNAILEALNSGDRFVQIGKYTLMLNAIKSIDPRYEPDNIPPRPKPVEKVEIVDGKAVISGYKDSERLALWDKLYGKQKMLND